MDDLRQYRQFLAVAEEGNLRRAAERLGLTHGTLAHTVRRLEDIYRVKLFERTKKGMEPTAYGRLLVEKAHNAIDLFEAFQREVRRLENRELGKLIIGCDPHFSEKIVGPAVKRLLDTYPNWAFEVRTSPWPRLKDQFEGQEIDVYIGLLPSEDVSRYIVEDIAGLPGVFACRPEHPLAGREAVSMAEVLEYQLAFLYMPDFEQQQDIEAAQPVIDPDLNIETDDIALLKYIIRNTDTVGPCLLHSLLDELDQGQLVLLDVVDAPAISTVAQLRARREELGRVPNDIVIISQMTRFPIPSVIEFRKVVKDVIVELAADYDELRLKYLKSG